jgi:hypothetical protein
MRNSLSPPSGSIQRHLDTKRFSQCFEQAHEPSMLDDTAPSTPTQAPHPQQPSDFFGDDELLTPRSLTPPPSTAPATDPES